MEKIYMVEITIKDLNGKLKKKVEGIKATDDLEAIDKVYEYYHKKLKKNIKDIKVI